MSDKDRLSIVLFNDEAFVLCGLRCMNTEGRQKVTELIGRIIAFEGTKIAAGIELALDILMKRAQTNVVCGILLLSDGQDYISRNDPIFEHVKALKCPLFSFGIGQDHQAECLQKLAVQGGTFTYIANISDIQNAFTATLNSLKSLAIRDCVLTVRFSGRGTVNRVLSGFSHEDINASSVRIRFSDCYFGESRKFVFDLKDAGTDFKCDAELAFQVVYSGSAVSVRSSGDVGFDPAQGYEIVKNRIRVIVSNAVQSATEMAEAGLGVPLDALDRTIVWVEDAIKQQLVGSDHDEVDELMEDLKRCKQMVKDGISADDSANMRHMASANLHQRAMPSQSASASAWRMVPNASK